MPPSGITPRVLFAVLVAELPPLVALVAVLVLSRNVLREADSVVLAAAVMAFALAWAGLVVVVFGRLVAEEARSLGDLMERGRDERPAGAADDATKAYRHVADTLDERNRQVAELARQASAAPISDDPRVVAAHVVAGTHRVMRDTTWELAVMISSMPDRLPPGVYGPEAATNGVAPLSDLQQWASVSGVDLETGQSPRRVDGPWGAFVVVEIVADDDVRAILYAPWEGRPLPSAAENDLFSLLGQHAGTALDHAILYSRVRSQADEIDRMAGLQRDFLRGVSHDLQTPLTSIRAVAGELRSQPSLDASGHADLDLIEQQADRLRRMVQQLLAVSRLEAGALEPRQEIVSTRPLLERTWAALRAAGRALDLQVEGPPMLLIADPDRLEQVLWAVFDNAVKYSPAGTPITARIATSQADDGSTRGTIWVQDAGPGMDPDTLIHAFDQFYRSEHARRIVPDGSGIGLYAARGLIQAMGGTIRVESSLGHGTTIVIELPAELAGESAAEASA